MSPCKAELPHCKSHSLPFLPLVHLNIYYALDVSPLIQTAITVVGTPLVHCARIEPSARTAVESALPLCLHSHLLLGTLLTVGIDCSS